MKNLICLAFAMAFAFISCSKQNESVLESTISPDKEDMNIAVEQAFPGVSGVTKNGFFRGTPVVYEDFNGIAVIGGDIIITPDQALANYNSMAITNGAGLKSLDYRWRYR